MNEKTLYTKKWFDYRPYMPDTASLLFVNEWVAAFDRLLVKMGFNHFEDNGKVIEKPFPFAQGSLVYLKARNQGEDWKMFTRLRQAADANCLPYWIFWNVGLQTMIDYDGFEFGLQAFNDSMLLGSTVDHAQARFNDGPIVFARMPFLQPHKYTGTQIQRAYCDHIVDRVKNKYVSRAHEILEKLAGDKLPLAYMEERFQEILLTANN